jgi:hypothetical protein
MNDIGNMITIILFVSLWYSLFVVGRALLKPYEKLKLIWCPELHSFSFIETQANAGGSTAVKQCLLWPEHERCKQRCLGERKAPVRELSDRT